MKKGLIQIFTGDGKGKTSSAVGAAVRAAGRGLKTVIIQFLKGMQSGEDLFFIKNPDPVKIHKACSFTKFYHEMNNDEKKQLKKETIAGFELAKKYSSDKTADIIILDEISYCINYGLIDLNELLSFLSSKDRYAEIIMTGRDFDPEITKYADLITEMKKIRHPYDGGMPSRTGFDI